MESSWFDDVPDRRGSGCMKWDEAPDSETLPLWVADMDFRTAPCVIRALEKRVAHGVFGYTLLDDEYYHALTEWFASRHDYFFERDAVIAVPGVVPAISAIIKALVPERHGVIVQTPVYNCFFSSIRNNGCRIVEAPLKRVDGDDGTFSYLMDFNALEEAASQDDVDLMLLCNPHNPAGRLWTRAELEKVAEICRRNNVRVVSDEIHCELTEPGREYYPYGKVDEKAVICLSPSKAFNTAGLQIANIITPDDETKQKIDRAVNINEVCDVNPFGPAALKAEYSEEGYEWLCALCGYLWANYDMLLERFSKELPECPVSRLEATYLPWVDVSALGIPAEKIEERMLKEAKVWVNCSEMYGADGYIRINIATSAARLSEGLDRIIGWLKKELKA
ncbi:MAG: pyridoxal phosphate-dependent aminotransferase [Bacteroides sp.]|nr:pyridoxal phosphate-dependent aminotransferase [Bacteroides sp.]MDE7441226.1 pyridoxal phosphate-dependent aminotransferase [Muribaculaceae bacterium]